MFSLLISLLQAEAFRRVVKAHCWSSYIVAGVYWAWQMMSGQIHAYLVILMLFVWSPVVVLAVMVIAMIALFNGYRWSVAECLWPAAYAILLTGFLWNNARQRKRQTDLERRKTEGLCLKCGYNLSGNSSGVCPECGEPVPEKLTGSVWLPPSQHW